MEVATAAVSVTSILWNRDYGSMEYESGFLHCQWHSLSMPVMLCNSA